MMPIYREIRLFDDTEISLGFIWQKLYERLHRALVPLKDAQGGVPVGFTFPRYESDFPLGDRLRVFAPDEAALEKLALEVMLADLSDYVKISEIQQTPTEHGHVVFYRKQFKTNPYRQARRYAKRHGVSYEEALQRYETFDVDKKIQNNKLPYFNFNSSSTGQKTRIFIAKGTVEHPREGKFTTFGLSKCEQDKESTDFDLSKCTTLPDF